MDDPWQALVALEAARRQDQRAWQTAAEVWGPTDTYIPERIWPEHELDAVNDVAMALRDAYADDAVAEYLGLYALHAQSEGSAGDRGVAATLEILDEAEDDLVVEAAASTLRGELLHTGETLSREELDSIDAAYGSMGDAMSRMTVAFMGAEQAVANGDWDVAQRWQGRVQQAYADLCVLGTTQMCGMYEFEVAATTGQIRALSRTQATTWTGAVTAAVWRCHLGEGAVEPGTTLEAEATFDGAWVFDWDGDLHPMHTCMDQQVPTEPPPPARMTLSLTVNHPE